MTRFIAIALAFSALIAVPACGKSGGTSCDDLVDHVQDISGIKIPDAVDASGGELGASPTERLSS